MRRVAPGVHACVVATASLVLPIVTLFLPSGRAILGDCPHPHHIGIIRLKRTGRTLTGRTAETTVIFDLDGTLVDTAPDLVETLNVVLGREGLAPVPYADGRMLVGGGARYMIERGLASQGTSRTK